MTVLGNNSRLDLTYKTVEAFSNNEAVLVFFSKHILGLRNIQLLSAFFFFNLYIRHKHFTFSENHSLFFVYTRVDLSYPGKSFDMLSRNFN